MQNEEDERRFLSIAKEFSKYFIARSQRPTNMAVFVTKSLEIQ